jgi:hypothetical protein
MLADNAPHWPVVLRIMPLIGSQAPIGYIYDLTPTRDGDGGLLEAASAFFAHQGHQVFLDPCPDLAAYCRAGGFTEPIVQVDWLPDHVLTAGLDLLESLSLSSVVDALSMSFMVAYLLAPAPAVSQGLVSLSPMGGDPEGRPLSVLSSIGYGGSRGSVHLFHPASLSSQVPSRSTRSVGHSSHLPASWGDARPHPDPKPCEQFSNRAPFYGSGQAPSYGSPCQVPSSIGYGGRSGNQDAWSPFLSSSLVRLTPHLGGVLNSLDINTSHWGSSSSSAASTLSDQVSIPLSVLGTLSAFSTPYLTPMAPAALPPLPAAILAGPIPLPIDRFTLPLIKMLDNYLAARDLIQYWPPRPGFPTARLDAALITDLTNALASLFWEGQIWTALKNGPARFLFKNTGSTYYNKGFEMLQVLEDNFYPSSFSNTITTLLSLFNDRQSDKEGIHEFCLHFKGNLLALSCSLVAIPQILQVMLFLRAIHLRYQDLLNQFASKQKDLLVASIDSVVADTKFMDEFVAVGANGKPFHPSSTLQSPAAATALTDCKSKEHCSPWEWLAAYNFPGILACWRRSLRGGFYCAFCHSKEKHHSLKCPMFAKLNLKLIKVGVTLSAAGAGPKPLAIGSSASGTLGTPGAKVAAAESPLAPGNNSPQAPAGMTTALVAEGDKDSADSFCWDGDKDGVTYEDTCKPKALVSIYTSSSPVPSCCRVSVELALANPT